MDSRIQDYLNTVMKKSIIKIPVVALAVLFGLAIFWQGQSLSPNKNRVDLADRQVSDVNQRNSVNNQAVPSAEARYRRLEDRLRMLEQIKATKQATYPLTDFEREQLAMEEIRREKEEEQRYIERLSAQNTRLNDNHAVQAIDSVWANAKEDNIVNSFEALGLPSTVNLADVDCRTDSCILDFTYGDADDEFSAANSETLFNWLMANSGNCEIHSEAGTANNSPNEHVTQRVHVVNCLD